MGFPRFYWYPTEGPVAPWAADLDPLLKVDIDEPITDLQYSIQRTVNDSVSMIGKKYRYYSKPYVEVRIVLDRFNDEALARDLYSMEAHLQKGGYVGFSNDRDKTWLSWIGSEADMAYGVSEVLASQTTAIKCHGYPLSGTEKNANFFAHWESAGAVAANDIVHLDGDLQRFNHEELKVGSVSLHSTAAGGTITPTGAKNRYDYNQGSVIRYRDFWPFLCLADNQVGKPLISHDYRLTYTFDATFRYYPGWQGLAERTFKEPALSQGWERADGSVHPGDNKIDFDHGIGSDGFVSGVTVKDSPGLGASIYDSIVKYK